MTIIYLPARKTDDLEWNEELALAEKAESLFWQFDFGLETGMLHLKDPALFSSCALALEQFRKDILPHYAEKTRGVSLFKGRFDIDTRLFWDAGMEEHFAERMADFGLQVAEAETRDLQRTLFSVDLFAQFLHRLLSILPEEIETRCEFDLQGKMNPTLATLLFSRARFEHLVLRLEGAPTFLQASSVEVGVLIPTDAVMTADVFKKLENLLGHLQEQKIIFRCIPELLLGEEWGGLEKLATIPDTLSVPGRRLLQGFTVAGGTIF